MKKSLLLVDDDEDYTFLMDCFLRKSGLVEEYKIENEVTTAIMYLQNCRAENFPQVIFIDINMPERDGFSFLQIYEDKFPRLFPETDIYMLTSSVRPSEYERAMSYKSVKDILIKPISNEQLESIFSYKNRKDLRF